MQAIAQQLLLDRKVGDYELPEGWFIWAAGNRVEDRAAVSTMPSPVANRMVHFNIDPDLDAWKEYAIESGINERIIAFLNFKPNLLHWFAKDKPAWPSPRSWDFANLLLNSSINIGAAVGEAVESEFRAFEKVYTNLPSIEKIFAGEDVEMPSEPSIIYALVSAFVSRASNAEEYYNAAAYLAKTSTEDWTALYLSDAFIAMKAKNLQGGFVKLASKDESIRKFISRYKELIA
jgi:hypothetical protein